MDKTALEALVGRVADEFTARLNSGEQPDIEEYARLYPEAAELLREILPSLEALRHETDDSEAEQGPACLPTLVGTCLGDFRILREIGRGGMGIVYEAEQLSLVRQVALKVLPFAAALDEKRLQRFQQEARAAAHLHHTNIVPVFAIGGEHGLHFYAMQYIAGQSLAAVIRELRQLSGRSPPEEPAPSGRMSPVSSGLVSGRWAEPVAAPASPPAPEPAAETLPQRPDPFFFRTVARLGIQAAEALEYAHRRGVVHRDIKPANLLVDERGDLWVTDFGTAQFRSDVALTATGDLVGTLRYMSPEQASGGRGLVDPRTDIYSLGLTLYELVTLEPAFPGHDREQLLRQVISDEPPPPRTRTPSLPRDLETIVLKAIAKNADERYARAGDLADDLRRFLEDKPVLARRPSLVERLAKWSRRHKALVRAVGVGLVLALVAFAVSTVMVWQANRRIEAAYQAEARARKRARQAANDMYTRFAEQWLANAPGMEEAQRELLLKALAFFEEEAAEHPTTREERYERALAHKRVGDIQHRLGNDAAALPAYERAIAVLQELVNESPGELECRLDLARCHAAWGGVAGEAGGRSAAERGQRRALAIAEGLVRDFPDDPRCRVAVVVFRTGLAAALNNLERFDEAEASYRAALPVAEQLVREFPEEPIYQKRLAGIFHLSAELARGRGRAADADERFRQALTMFDRLASKYPDHPEYRSAWAGVSRRLAELLTEGGRIAQAERVLNRSVATVFEEYMRRFPRTAGYREEAAPAWEALGRIDYAAGRPAAAEEAFRRSIELFQEGYAQRPERTQYAVRLAGLYADCPVEKVRDRARALDYGTRATRAEPDSSGAWLNLGVAHYRRGEWAAARSAFATGLRKPFAEIDRGNFYLAMTHARQGDGEAARRAYADAVRWMDARRPRDPALLRLRTEAGEVVRAVDSGGGR